MRKVEKVLVPRTLYIIWMNHLDAMDHLRDSVKLKAYGHQDPLVEYKTQGHQMFQRLLEIIETSIIQNLLRAELKETKREAPPTVVPTGNKVDRNQPCPCGSGKKYKKCCWPKYD